VPKPIKLLEGIGNRGNGTLIWSTAILWTYDQHFILLRSTVVYGKPSPVDNLQIYISCPCRRVPFYCPMLILACLTGVSSLVVYLCQWLQTTAAKGVAAAMANNKHCGSTIASLFFIAAGTSLPPRTVHLFHFQIFMIQKQTASKIYCYLLRTKIRLS